MNLDSKLAMVRSVTRSLLVVGVLAILAYAVLFSAKELITSSTRGNIVTGLCVAFGMAATFYYKQDEEHREVTHDDEKV